MIQVTSSNGVTCIRDTEEESGDGSHLDVYSVDVPQLIVDLMRTLGIDVESNEYVMDLLS